MFLQLQSKYIEKNLSWVSSNTKENEKGSSRLSIHLKNSFAEKDYQIYNFVPFIYLTDD